MNTLKKNLGIIIILLGAAGLFVAHYTTLADENWATGGSFLLMVIGLVLHIYMNKRILE